MRKVILKKRFLLIVVLALVSVLIVTGCHNKDNKNVKGKESLDEVKGKNDFSDLGTVKVGMDGETPPFSTIDEKGNISGFEVELWEEIGKHAGFNVEIERMEFSGLFSMLDDGRLDSIANVIAITPEREEKYLFSDGYIYEKNMLLANADKKINDLKDMNGWSIAVEPASVDEGIVTVFEEMAGIELERVYYDGAAINDVVLGRVDLWVKGEAGCLEVIEKIGDDKLQIIADTTDVAISGYPFVKDDRGERLKDAVNYALEELRKDGTMNELSKKYLAIDITKVPEQN